MKFISEIWKEQFEPRSIVKWLADAALADAVISPLYALDPFQTQFDDVEEAQYYESTDISEAPDPGDELSVMTWNIKFGGGRIDFWFDGHGDRVVMKEGEVRANLEGLASKIRQVDPDVLLIQEIDVDSKRVAYIDQMQWLLDHTGLNYGAYASQWRATIVPSDGLGRVDMGIAVMSKYPIRDAQRLALPQLPYQDRLTRYFYLKRAILTAQIELPDQEPVYAVNTHTEAFARDDTKKRQLECFVAELNRIDRAGGVFVAGGDLNTLPPGTTQWHDFDDVVVTKEEFEGSDYRQETRWMEPIYQCFEAAIPVAEYAEDNGPYFTHSTTGEIFWSRKLDYLFTNRGFVPGSAVTHQQVSQGGMETMPLSDHAPVTVTLDITAQ